MGSRYKWKKKYLDFIQGIAVTNLGHNHPKVNEAIKEQLDHVWHVSNLFENGLQEKKAAEKLAENSSGDLVFFCNSGAEANEGAIKLARKATKKQISSHFCTLSMGARMLVWLPQVKIKSKLALVLC
ncbi:hypothetical protein BsIDN1_20670 [Bacillus safensis]|uniref:Acetylornithine aminotransferase n=1 Tax=Bacillus safensis TaxID=561879 RepID=A0A5S9M928_BACIA|nr:hypothetical protein BsIDN1_20670 [Bacillus safensis]